MEVHIRGSATQVYPVIVQWNYEPGDRLLLLPALFLAAIGVFVLCLAAAVPRPEPVPKMTAQLTPNPNPVIPSVVLSTAAGALGVRGVLVL